MEPAELHPAQLCPPGVEQPWDVLEMVESGAPPERASCAESSYRAPSDSESEQERAQAASSDTPSASIHWLNAFLMRTLRRFQSLSTEL
ncbi:hypothetical protein ASNO1_17100 [Corallococcus caeni]|uniref:Uncharacterized protein n=1 Tax=Corallococcus caeni TaxID=3082388 RepID=A0ABQ6QN52_9BACT|nr:hypothetical protein ASNO1_17100 [Corallococcus sp. NO1]